MAALALPWLGPRLAAQPAKEARVLSPDSIVEIPALTFALPARRPQPLIVRTALTADETAEVLNIEVALRMRNFDELQARVQRGELISREDMAARYYPLAADHDALVAWLRARGLTITRTDANHLAVFASGPVSLIREVFQTEFARVTYDGQEFTSAVTAPSVPAGLAAALVGINGLQPHLRVHKRTDPGEIRPMVSNRPPYTPAEILRAYGASGLALTGAGQTIAIVIDTYPADSDLTMFWSTLGVAQSLTNIQEVQVGSATLPAPSGEETLDVEWTSGLAPAAKIRIYATGQLKTSLLNQAYQQIAADLPSQPGLHQLALSYGLRENDTSVSLRQTEGQYLANLASGGVTIFASAGDGGSNPGTDGNYSANAAAQTELPASDVNVTGVGGTTLNLDAATGSISSETAWTSSGGGGSAYSSRPSWQTGTGVPTGTMRVVPDVAAVADLNTGCFLILNGNQYRVGGTSLSAPLWTGLCALLNQARANASRTPLSLLGPKIYPLIGTTSFRDITSGSNGAYTAAAGYDMVTGVGTPSLAALVQALAGTSYVPEITTQPVNQWSKPGQTATFTVVAAGNPAPTFQWQRQPVGGSTWSNLSDGGNYSGTATATLTVSKPLETMNGDSFRCVASNANGNTTTAPAALLVSFPLTVTTLAGQTGAAGVGGADGTGSAAQFNYPCDVAVDGTGNVFVADTYNHNVRKITPGGVVTTLAGQAGISGTADGTGSAARFYYPLGITIDGSGNLFIADSFNHTIRKVTSAGAVTTVAGLAGTSGSADGVGTAARFYSPCDVTVDGSGNLYVADTLNATIRKITPDGTVTTLAGVAGATGSADGTGAAGRFNSPEGMAVDGSGNLYVADTNNCTIRKVTRAGVVTTVAGLAGVSGSTDGAGNLVRFNSPFDLAVDGSGNIYVADSENFTIRKISSSGIVSTVAGTAGASGSSNGTGSAARFSSLSGIAVDSSGNLFVADTDNNLIRMAVSRSAPEILTHPQSQTVTTGTNVTFTVLAVGMPTPTYQWYKAGTAIGGATSDTLSLTNVQTTDASSYTATATNAAGSATSNAATLMVNTPVIPPSGGGSSGGGGGGGALPAWFVLALVLLGAARRAAMLKRTSRLG